MKRKKILLQTYAHNIYHEAIPLSLPPLPVAHFGYKRAREKYFSIHFAFNVRETNQVS